MWSLNAPRAHTLPFALHTAVFHLNSSVNFESASLITLRKRAIVLPRQPVSPAICLSICLDALIPNSFLPLRHCHRTLHYDARYFPDLRRGATHRIPATKVLHGTGPFFC